MTFAVNANFQPMFRESSALETCTQKLRDLFTKVHEFFMKILQTILPCVFGKSAPVVTKVVQPPVLQPVQAVVAPPTPAVAVVAALPQSHAAPPAVAVVEALPQSHAAPLPAPAVAVVEALPQSHAAPLPAPAVAVEEALPQSHAAPPAPAVAVVQQAQRSPKEPREKHEAMPSTSSLDPDTSKLPHLVLAAPPRQAPNEKEFAAKKASALRALGRPKPTTSAAAEPAKEEMRLLGETGLDELKSKAGSLVCFEAFIELWEQMLNPHSLKISPEDLDRILKIGVSNYEDCCNGFAEKKVPVDMIIKEGGAQSVDLDIKEGSIQEILAKLQAAKKDQLLLGAFLVRKDETSLIFISSGDAGNQFFVLDPNGLISLYHFEDEKGVVDSFLSNRKKENKFSVFALKKVEQTDDPNLDRDYQRHSSTLTREEAIALAASSKASR